MKKRKMIIFGCLFLLGVVIGLTACLLSDDSSKQLELTYSYAEELTKDKILNEFYSNY